MSTIFDRLRQDGIDTTDLKKLAKTLGVDYAEVTKKATRDTRDDVGDVLEDAENPETTNAFPKPGMTKRDIVIMEGIKSRDEDKFNKLMEVLEYGDDYIQIRLPKAGILKIDRKDLGLMKWQKAMNKAKSLGKRLMTIYELEELPKFIGLKDCRDIFNFKKDLYWSKSTVANGTAGLHAHALNFDSASVDRGGKANLTHVRLAHQ